MGYEKLGSDQAQLAGFGGGVISEEGAVLLSGESTGEESLLFGPASLREIKAGVANGDFAIPPLDPLATIVQDGNPLPYWTFTDVNSAGAITAAIVADTNAASGNKLTFTVASGTLTGKSVTLTRYVAIPSSRSRSFSFYAEAHFLEGTASSQSTVTLSCQYYTADLATTGSDFNSLTFTFGDLQGATGQGISAPNLYEYLGTPSLANTTAPSNAAFLKLTITIATVATQSAARTVSLTEVRVSSGLPELLFTDKNSPSTRNPARITNQNAVFALYDGSGNSELYLSNISGVAAGITTTQSIGITAGVAVLIEAPNGTDVSHALTVGTDLDLDTRHTIKSNNASTILFTRNDTGNRSGIVVGRIFPGDQTTRYIEDNGTRIALNSGIDLSGSVVCSGAMTSDAISTTTQTASAAIWVLSSGTTYSLRRNSSSARYKTAITDADEAVLTAARQVRPRHYESTIADENGATRLGFIAEEVHDAGLTHAVGYDAEGRPESLDSTALIAALWHRVNDLESRLAAIEAER
jgi:hypothetical protein